MTGCVASPVHPGHQRPGGCCCSRVRRRRRRILARGPVRSPTRRGQQPRSRNQNRQRRRWRSPCHGPGREILEEGSPQPEEEATWRQREGGPCSRPGRRAAASCKGGPRAANAVRCDDDPTMTLVRMRAERIRHVPVATCAPRAAVGARAMTAAQPPGPDVARALGGKSGTEPGIRTVNVPPRRRPQGGTPAIRRAKDFLLQSAPPRDSP